MVAADWGEMRDYNPAPVQCFSHGVFHAARLTVEDGHCGKTRGNLIQKSWGGHWISYFTTFVASMYLKLGKVITSFNT